MGRLRMPKAQRPAEFAGEARASTACNGRRARTGSTRTDAYRSRGSYRRDTLLRDSREGEGRFARGSIATGSLLHLRPKSAMRRACQACSSSSGAAERDTGGSSRPDARLIPVIRPSPATVRTTSARNTWVSLRVTIQTIAWGIDYHGDDKVSSDLCSLAGSIRLSFDCGELGCLSLGHPKRTEGSHAVGNRR